MIDLTPVFILSFIGLGALAGFALALLAWPIFGFGWWTLALPAAGAVILVVIARELDR